MSPPMRDCHSFHPCFFPLQVVSGSVDSFTESDLSLRDISVVSGRSHYINTSISSPLRKESHDIGDRTYQVLAVLLAFVKMVIKPQSHTLPIQTLIFNKKLVGKEMKLIPGLS